MIVLCIGDETAPVLGTSDPLISEWIEINGYIPISWNRPTIPVHLQEHFAEGEVPGIFLICSKATIAQMIDNVTFCILEKILAFPYQLLYILTYRQRLSGYSIAI
jgi:hypothetical protein